MVEMAFREAFRAIKRVYPDDHVLLEELVRELVVVVVSLGCGHAVNLLHLLQVTAVAVPLHVVVLNEHLLTDMILVKLVGHNIWTLGHDLVFHLVLLANDRSARIQLRQIVYHGVLDMNIDLGEYILSTSTLLEGDVCET